MKRATISDVAELAGVSIKTVSRVLNREARVLPATRERVQDAMAQLKYRPNTSARRLASNRTFLLGLIYNASSSYITRIQNGVLEACHAEHYDLLIHPCTAGSTDLEEEITQLVTEPRVDGLILTPPVSDRPEVMALVERLNAPHVVIARAESDEDPWTVGTNDRTVCRDMVAHLVGLGHRRIAFVQGNPGHRAMGNRYLGYRAGLRRAGLEERGDWTPVGDNSFASGERIGTSLLDLPERPTAIFCANDHMAAGVMVAAHRRGIAIPDALSVVGFDDIPMAHQVWPPLTTIRQPLGQMARLAAQLLIQRLRGQDPGNEERVIQAQPVLRESTGPAPGD